MLCHYGGAGLTLLSCTQRTKLIQIAMLNYIHFLKYESDKSNNQEKDETDVTFYSQCSFFIWVYVGHFFPSPKSSFIVSFFTLQPSYSFVVCVYCDSDLIFNLQWDAQSLTKTMQGLAHLLCLFTLWRYGIKRAELRYFCRPGKIKRFCLCSVKEKELFVLRFIHIVVFGVLCCV